MLFWVFATLLFTGVALSWLAMHRSDSARLQKAAGFVLIGSLLVLGYTLPNLHRPATNPPFVSVAEKAQ
jgi:hypothetical protein